MRDRRVHQEQVGAWHFKVRQSAVGPWFMGWCARTPKLGNGPLDVDWESLEVHFHMATSIDDCLSVLKREVL